MDEVFSAPSAYKKVRKPRTTKPCPRCGKGHYKLNKCPSLMSSESSGSVSSLRAAPSTAVSELSAQSDGESVDLSAPSTDSAASEAIMLTNRSYLRGFGYIPPPQAVGLLLPQDNLEGEFHSSRRKRQDAWLMHAPLRITNIDKIAQANGYSPGSSPPVVLHDFHYPQVLDAESFNETTDELRKCMVCANKSYVRCNRCDVFLCASGSERDNCYWKFHTCHNFVEDTDNY